MKKFIDENAKQYKANLHSHSVHSDGHLTPEQLKEAYKKQGYSILAVTDHEHLLNHSDLNDEDFILITAYEMYIRTLPFNYLSDSQAHINLYSKTPDNKMLYYTPSITKYIPQEELKTLCYHKLVEERQYSVDFLKQTIEDAKKCGYIVCHNHPTWSLEDQSVASAYDGCFAMEIYNNDCYQLGYCEYNQHYYEYQLNRGLKMFPIASDDNHNPPNGVQDSFGGFTYILAKEFGYGGIISALENGDFYASTGPRIYSLVADNGELSVTTSPAERIMFITDNHHRKAFIAKENESVNKASFNMNPTDKWLRIEVVDDKGRRAFSRAFTFDEING